MRNDQCYVHHMPCNTRNYNKKIIGTLFFNLKSFDKDYTLEFGINTRQIHLLTKLFPTAGKFMR